MPRPEGTSKCKEPGCERGTIWTDYCRKHRIARGLQTVKVAPTPEPMPAPAKKAGKKKAA